MKLKCQHGFFYFEETRIGEASDFISTSGLDLVPWRAGYTFELLGDVPAYTLAGKAFLGLPATKSYEGEPGVLFEQNGVVYDFTKGILVPIASVTQRTTVELAGNRFISPGLILPGSITDGGRVKDYAAWFTRDRWLYSEVTYV